MSLAHIWVFQLLMSIMLIVVKPGMLRGYGLPRSVLGDPVFGAGMRGHSDRPGDEKSQAT